jgi:manganese transport protein
LFGFPLWLGALLTILIVFLAIIGQKYHTLERMIVGFLGIIALCYVAELYIVKPDWAIAAKSSFIPVINKSNIFVAMAMLGAVVMPHNIYLHSNVILSRDWGSNSSERKKLINFEKADTVLAMVLGWIVNSAMIIVAASVFFRNGVVTTSIEQASETLNPLAGFVSHLLFGIALLFSGVGSSITSSFAEANVFTAFLGKPENPRSMFYRFGLVITSIPAFLVIISGLDTYRILLLSQFVLSVQLPFTIIPLLVLASSKKVMGEYRAGKYSLAAGIVIAAIVISLNVYFIISS